MQQAERDRRAAERAAQAAERDEKARYIAARREEAVRRTSELEAWVTALTHILHSGVRRSAKIDLRAYYRTVSPPLFDAGPLAQPSPRPRWQDFEPPAPGALSSLFGGRSRYDQAMDAARRQFGDAEARWKAQELKRRRSLAEAQARYENRVAAERAACDDHNRKVSVEMAALADRQRASVERYLEQVLSRMPMPSSFPRRAEVAYNPGAEQVVVQVQLPGTDVVPAVKSYRYVQSGLNADTMPETRRPEKEVKELYRDVVAQVALLAVRDLFDADEHLREVAFNGHVDTVNPATGQQEYPCIVSLDVERERFAELVLDRVSPADCLR